MSRDKLYRFLVHAAVYLALMILIVTATNVILAVFNYKNHRIMKDSELLVTMNIDDSQQRIIHMSDHTFNQKIVPEGMAQSEDETDKITIEFKIFWQSKVDVDQDALLTAVVKNVWINQENTVASDLLQIVFINGYEQKVSCNKETSVIVHITLKEPKNQETYLLIADQSVIINFEFHLTMK